MVQSAVAGREGDLNILNMHKNPTIAAPPPPPPPPGVPGPGRGATKRGEGSRGATNNGYLLSMAFIWTGTLTYGPWALDTPDTGGTDTNAVNMQVEYNTSACSKDV